MLAAVSDAFDLTGPEKAWETLQAAEQGAGGSTGDRKGIALLKQEKTEAYGQLRQQLQVRGRRC